MSRTAMATWFSRPIMKGSPEPRQSPFHTGPERTRLAVTKASRRPRRLAPRGKSPAQQKRREEMMRGSRIAAVYLASTALVLFAPGQAARAGHDGGGGGVQHAHYDGVSNDLLTAGLGKTGLGGA